MVHGLLSRLFENEQLPRQRACLAHRNWQGHNMDGLFDKPSLCHAMQVMFLKGLRYIYQFNIFLYMMMGIMGISIIIQVIKGPGKWKRTKREDAYQY